MKIRKNDIASSKNSRAGAACRYENLLGLLATRDSLRGFAVVTFENSAEFSFASNSAFCLWYEVFVEHGVVSSDTAMRSLLVIILQPYVNNVVEFSSTEANEAIQHFPLCSFDEALAKMHSPSEHAAEFLLASRLPLSRMHQTHSGTFHRDPERETWGRYLRSPSRMVKLFSLHSRPQLCWR